jgi:peroxiredoxin
MKYPFIATATLVCLACVLLGQRSESENDRTAPPDLAKPIANFSLLNTSGQPVRFSDFKDKKAVVVVFVGTECPINNAFMPRLAELQRAYAPKGVQFLAINSNMQDSAAAVAEHARKFAVPFPVLKDSGSKVADLFGAQRTPEAFVLDERQVVRYQGRIDDQYGIGYTRPLPKHRDMVEAIDALLAGKAVPMPTTQVQGCLIARAVRPKANVSVTYTEHVARILQKNCQECHQPGQIGPMSLLTYDDAAAWAETIREVVADRRMPPWLADPHFGKFSNDRSLSKKESDTLLAWVDQGCPKGDDRFMPPPRTFVPGWRIGKPEVIFSMKDAYDVQATAPKTGIPYQYFEIESGFTEDRWVQRAEAKGGAAAVVHHIVVFIVPPGLDFNPQQGNAPVLCGTAPGDMPLILPPGTAKRIPARSKFVFQMHYTANGTAQKDRSSVGLIFADKAPDREVLTIAMMNPELAIPPGADNYKRESMLPIRNKAYLYNFMPHMHLRGKDFLYEAVFPDGRKETLLWVPRYNFNWQNVYRCARPVEMPAGSKLHCVAHYDNSANNPNNPDPTKLVLWGDQTWEEMMIGWVDVAFESQEH